jgi:tRNA pseudouridine38-40 synthase
MTRRPDYNPGVPRFKLIIEYAGTRYSGWQIQKNARTVQGEIDRAIRTVTRRRDFELYGSGRTDAGVHALGQVAHLDVITTLGDEPLRQRLNDELPADINILAIERVPHRFHARHDAVGRRYIYQISRRRTAFAKPYVWWIKEPLDLPAIRAAMRSLVGMRDFGRFAERDADDGEPRSTIVLVERLDLIEDGALIVVVIEGSHFLWKMVRRIVGALTEVGRGRPMPDEPARFTAPPSGLFLERVFYPGDRREAPPRIATPLWSNSE